MKMKAKPARSGTMNKTLKHLCLRMFRHRPLAFPEEHHTSGIFYLISKGIPFFMYLILLVILFNINI